MESPTSQDMHNKKREFKHTKVTLLYFNHDTLEFDVLGRQVEWREYVDAISCFHRERRSLGEEGFRRIHSKVDSTGLGIDELLEKVEDGLVTTVKLMVKICDD